MKRYRKDVQRVLTLFLIGRLNWEQATDAITQLSLDYMGEPHK